MRRRTRRNREAGLLADIVQCERWACDPMRDSGPLVDCKKDQHACGGWQSADTPPLRSSGSAEGNERRRMRAATGLVSAAGSA